MGVGLEDGLGRVDGPHAEHGEGQGDDEEGHEDEESGAIGIVGRRKSPGCAGRRPGRQRGETMPAAKARLWKTASWRLPWACWMKARALRGMTGRTQGMKLRMKPPRMAKRRSSARGVLLVGGVEGWKGRWAMAANCSAGERGGLPVRSGRKRRGVRRVGGVGWWRIVAGGRRRRGGASEGDWGVAGAADAGCEVEGGGCGGIAGGVVAGLSPERQVDGEGARDGVGGDGDGTRM